LENVSGRRMKRMETSLESKRSDEPSLSG
jgi:hypothetical protein